MPFHFLAKEGIQAKSSAYQSRTYSSQTTKELLVVGFYLWYFVDFLIKYIKYRQWNKAYRNIIFEREAYSNEKDLNYLKTRGFWWFLAYK